MKINKNEIINLNEDRINAISKNNYVFDEELINELKTIDNTIITAMPEEKKRSIKNNLTKDQNILKQLGDDKLKALLFTKNMWGNWSGGIKTKRSKVKKNKTRRL